MKTAIPACWFAFAVFAASAVIGAETDSSQAEAVFFPDPGDLLQTSWSATPHDSAPAVRHCPHSCGDDFWTRKCLTSGFLGTQPALAKHGIVADIDLIQFYQGVTGGGSDQTFLYGGKVDYNLTFVGEQLGLWKGFTTIMHAETRFGDSLVGEAGAFTLPNTNMLYPLPSQHNTAITGLLFMQALNEKVALAAGKINVVDLWNMVYPHTGRGVDGFMNLNSLAVGLPWLRFVNLSVNGGGVLVMEGKQIQGGFLVFDTNNSTTTDGVDNLFDKGAACLGLWRCFTDWDGKPGSHLLAGGWSNRTYTSLDRNDWLFIPGQGGGLNPGEKNGAWALAYYFDQVFWADPCNADRNLRLFTGWSLSDGDPSFGQWGGLVSVEGFGLVNGREQDRMGVSYFYTGVSDDFKQLVSPVVQLKGVQGVELYYNAEITPWFHLTADLQIVDNETEADDTAIIAGLRGKVDF